VTRRTARFWPSHLDGQAFLASVGEAGLRCPDKPQPLAVLLFAVCVVLLRLRTPAVLRDHGRGRADERGSNEPSQCPPNAL